MRGFHDILPRLALLISHSYYRECAKRVCADIGLKFSKLWDVLRFVLEWVE